MEVKPEGGKFCANALQDLRQIIVQHDRRSRDPQLRRPVLAEPLGDNINVLEERPDELEKLRARGRECKWTPLKKLGAERFLEFGDLPANSRLLNAVGNVAHRCGDAAVFCNEVEQLQMMNVHDRKG